MTTAASGTPHEPPGDRTGAGRPHGSGATDALRLGQLTAAATRVVTQAASVLEDEIAAGITAAEQVERHFIDVDRVRNEDPAVVLQRFRKDAHDVVDILIDIVNVAVSSASGLASQAIRLRDAGERRGTRTPPAATTAIPTLPLPGTVPPGGASSTTMSVDNDGDEPLDEFGFTVTDLLGAEGGRIPGTSVHLEPSSVTVRPHGSERVTVNVSVPENVAPGTYSGLLQATRLSTVRAVVVVTVG